MKDNMNDEATYSRSVKFIFSEPFTTTEANSTYVFDVFEEELGKIVPEQHLVGKDALNSMVRLYLLYPIKGSLDLGDLKVRWREDNNNGNIIIRMAYRWDE